MSEGMRLRDKLAVIEQLPVFAGLTAKEKLLIASSGALVEYKKGARIYSQGEAAGSFYCVVTGRIKASIERRGREETLEYLKRGKYFGIISLLTKEPHSVSTTAVNDSILLEIKRGPFETIVEKVPFLILHVSQTLSRRLKHKDLREKKIFESTIVSAYGTSDTVGVSTYILNLALSLAAETKKRVILITLQKPGEEPRTGPLMVRTPFFRDDEVASAISKNEYGLETLCLARAPGDAADTANITPLLGYLTDNYHYILVDLLPHMDKVSFETMKQSDFVHLITRPERIQLESAGKIAGELVKSLGGVADRVKVITAECANEPFIPYRERQEILAHPIFATLPAGSEATASGRPAIQDDHQCDYSRAIRRIARQVGEVRVGLALGCGASLGFAHVGVLKVLEEERIPIDLLAGTSMGAFIGALWASGKSIDEIEAVVAKYRRTLENIKLMDFTFPRRGIIKGIMVRKLLRSQFGDRTFYDLKLPFKAVACDIRTRREVVIDTGRLEDAVMASVAIPGIFEPVPRGDELLVDGGIVDPLPTGVLSRAGVNRIIAVNTLPSPDDIMRSRKKVTNIFDIIVNSVQASEYLLAEMNCQNADVALHPVVPTLDWYEFYEGARAVKRGEEEARKYLPQIRELVSQ